MPYEKIKMSALVGCRFYTPLRFKKSSLMLFLIMITSISLKAQLVDDESKLMIKGSISYPVKMGLQEGKFIVGGNISMVGEAYVNNLFRLNTDYSLDETFNLDIEITGRINDILVQNDQKIIIAGQDLCEKGNLIRLNQNGSYDESFTLADSLKNIDFIKVRRQSDGAYIVLVFPVAINGVSKSILRFTADGIIDEDFKGGAVSGIGLDNNDVEIDNRDNILLGGSFQTYNGEQVNGLVRLNSDGSYDSSFPSGTGPSVFLGSPIINDIQLLENDELVLAGRFSEFNGKQVNGIVKLTTEGAVMDSFQLADSDANQFSKGFSQVKYLSNNKLLIGNVVFMNGEYLYKAFIIDDSGNSDTTFNGLSYKVAESQISLYTPETAQSDNGNLVTVGSIISFDEVNIMGLAVADSIGDPFENMITIGSNGSINTIDIDKNGRVILGGSFLAVNEFRSQNIVRLNSNGSIDTAFIENIATGFDRGVSVINVDENNNILVGGGFDNLDGNSVPEIIRLTESGRLDTAFNASITNFFVNEGVTIIKNYNRGYLIGGESITFNSGGTVINNFMKLNSDGSLDTLFDTSGLLDNSMQVQSIAIQQDGKVLIGGQVQSNGGFLIRSNTDGTKDNSFTHALDLSNRQIISIDITETNKILLGTEFATSFPSNESKTIWQLNLDGTRIDSDELQITSTGSVNEIEALSEDSIVLAGNFTSINNLEREGFAIVDVSGQVLPTDLQVGIDRSDYDESVNAVLITDQFTYLGGRFTRLSTLDNFSGFARIDNCGSTGFSTVESCDFYEWGEMIITESGSYERMLKNKAGCDSLAILQVTIINSSSGSQEVTACDFYEWEGSTFNESGLYETVLQNSVGCDSIAVLDLTIVKSPGGELNFTDDVLSYVPQSDEDTSTFDYKWIDCQTSEALPDEVGSELIIERNGRYSLLVSNGDCSFETECFEVQSILSLQKEFDYTLYPNPFQQELYLDFSESLDDVTVSIIDLAGSIVKLLKKDKISRLTSIDLKDLNNGIYTIILRKNGQVIFNEKILKLQ